MSCSNCYNGCVEIVSDQCVKYTGVDVPVLGIKTGDSLSYVEQALIGFLVSTLDGTGIKLNIDQNIICDVINKYLVSCQDLTLPNIITALIKAICEVEARLNIIEDDFAALEAPYTVDCLDNVSDSSGTHAVLQAAINKICLLKIYFEELALDVDTNYVKIADINSYIAAYLASIGTTTKYYNRMVPYTVVEFYGDPTGKFDVTGAGLGDWEKIYLCNGNNGTPDKRGRVPVGATSGMGGGPLNPAVDPGVSGNPSYTLLSTAGSNTVTLSTSQIPAHTHIATATVIDPGHFHTISQQSDSASGFGKVAVGSQIPEGTNPVTDSATTGITVSVTNSSAGGGLAHPNYQPGLGCYYIMYIP